MYKRVSNNASSEWGDTVFWIILLVMLRMNRGEPRPLTDYTLGVIALFWAAEAAWEWMIGPETNIRIDLLVIVPFMGLVTMVGLGVIIWEHVRPKEQTRDEL